MKTQHKYRCLGLATLCCLAFCSSHAQAGRQRLTAAMRIADYTSNPIHDSVPADPTVELLPSLMAFPVLDVYSPKGALVFHSISESESRRIILDFAHSIRSFHKVADADSLDTVLHYFPNHPDTKRLFESHGYVILTISLSRCDSCIARDHLLEADHDRLAENNVSQLYLVLTP